MKYVWKDLPKSTDCFTIRNATMRNLNNGEVIQHYAANTKLAVVQKCVTERGTYYRTYSAMHHNLNWAFEASALGLPNEKAPSAHSEKPKPLGKSILKTPPASRTPKPAKKQTSIQKTESPKGGEEKRLSKWIKKIFRRKNG